jgi:hypothetical protein
MIAAATAMLCLVSLVGAQDGPALPDGLPAGDGASETESGGASGPSLPSGLPGGEDDDASAGTSPPTGLDDDGDDATAPDEADDRTWLDMVNDAGMSGFWEVRGGMRTQNDPYQNDVSLAETRLQIDWREVFDGLTVQLTGDLVYDQADHHMSNVNLNTGSGWFDLREAWVAFSPLAFLDVKAGRQVLTWGTGNYVFLNDIFPKDWLSYFLGRDLEYLKAPSDALRLSVFTDIVNAEFVYMPHVLPSRGITGRRLSYYSPQLGRPAGQDAVIDPERPDECFDDAVYAMRLYRRIGSYELAAYGSWGVWQTPEGFDPARGVAFYPRLNTYGASVRGPLLAGIANMEVAWYDSRDDRHGTNPFVRNSEMRILVGYEQDLPEIADDLTVGVQYYVEIMADYDSYRDALLPGQPQADPARHWVTFNVTKQLINQNLTLDLFAYYSPSSDDAYFRPSVSYKIDDHWTATLGGNVFVGSHNHTFFGQFERNSNVYASLRFGF